MPRFGFVTCVELGRACLEAVLTDGAEFAMAMTLKDELARNKSGRCYLDDLAETHSIPLTKIRHINDPDAITTIRAADLDWLFIIGWSQIAGPEVLDSTRNGVLGMHPTLLPEGRGRAAIPWAILKGLDQTGVTMFKLDDGVDTGPIVAQEIVPIDERETAASLYAKVTDAHVSLMRGAWPQLQSPDVPLRTQDEAQASYWPGRTPADGKIDPRRLTTAEVDRTVRALTHPYPGAFIEQHGGRVTIWDGIPERNVHLPDALIIETADGWYTATSYDQEPYDTFAG